MTPIQELFFDLLVYSRNRCFRLPWSNKMGEYRPFVPVVRGIIRDDIEPKLDIIERTLCNYFPKGVPPPSQILRYDEHSLVPRSVAPKSMYKNVKAFVGSDTLEKGIIPAMQTTFVFRLKEAVAQFASTKSDISTPCSAASGGSMSLSQLPPSQSLAARVSPILSSQKITITKPKLSTSPPSSQSSVTSYSSSQSPISSPLTQSSPTLPNTKSVTQ